MKKQALFLVIAVILFISAVYVLSTPSITGFLTRTGQFTLGNEQIWIYSLYLNDQECTDDNPTDCTITGIENTTKSVTVKITIEDQNGNCDEFTSNNGTAYLCDTLGQGYCNTTNAKHTVTDLEYDAADGQWGDSNEYCNLTGTAFDMQFYEVHGDYNITVSVTDGTSTDTYPFMWYYNEIRAITYPASGSTINLGALTLNQWNNGTGQALMQNSGNIILSLDWNASDFTGGTYADTVEIDGTNFKIDDDNASPDDTDSLSESTIEDNPLTTIAYEPAFGLMNCSSVACSNQNATMNIYWHLELPYGLHSDTYTDTIEVATFDWTDMRLPVEPGGGGIN